MPNKLSFSQINTYTTCGQKYFLHYQKRMRSIFQHAALCFGSAIDAGLNKLLETRDEEKAHQEFDLTWSKQYINNIQKELRDCELIIYADSDMDIDLLDADDFKAIQNYFTSHKLQGDPRMMFDQIREKKKELGYKGLSLTEQKVHNLFNWHSLWHKGHLMIRDYNIKVMPKIVEVKAVQHKTSLVNGDGDEVVQVLDLVAQWEDGSVILFDNKTSSREYDSDSAGTSQQLISYYYNNKEQFNITAVGFIVLHKGIKKNTVKTCTKCGKISDSNRVKTCAVEVDGKRCGGAFEETMNPECYIQVIVNPVTEHAEDLVLATFDEANSGIKQGNFYRNLLACKNGSMICPFREYCWKGNTEDITVLEEREKRG